MFALSSYRTVYAAIWDWRINHIPLHRRKAFVPADDVVGMGWTMTRRAVWGRRRGAKIGDQEKPPAPAENMPSARDGGVVRSRTDDARTVMSPPQTTGTMNGGGPYSHHQGRVVPGTVDTPRVSRNERSDRRGLGANMV